MPSERAEDSPKASASSWPATDMKSTVETTATTLTVSAVPQRNPATDPSVQLSTRRAASASPAMITTIEV